MVPKTTVFMSEILQGIPQKLPPKYIAPKNTNRAPKRKDSLSKQEKQLAIRNGLRYFPEHWHSVLSKEFAQELLNYGRIYMFRFKPSYAIYAPDSINLLHLLLLD